MGNQLLDHGRSAFCVVTPDEALQQVIAALIELELGARCVVGPSIEAVEQLLGEALPKLFIVGDSATSTDELSRTIGHVRGKFAGTPVIAVVHQAHATAIADVPVLTVCPLDAAQLIAEIRTQLRLPPAKNDGTALPKDGA